MIGKPINERVLRRADVQLKPLIKSRKGGSERESLLDSPIWFFNLVKTKKARQ